MNVSALLDKKDLDNIESASHKKKILLNQDLQCRHSHLNVFTYSYAWAGDTKLIDQGFYDAISADDIRKGQFDGRLLPAGKFFDPARIIRGQRDVTTDYVYMRIEEMYLPDAEAKVRLNQDGPAREMLMKIVERRMTSTGLATYFLRLNGLSGQQLGHEIFLQIRIEFWGEGKSFLAVKRNKATITRGSNHLYEAGKSFSYNSDELRFPIPQQEILNNPLPDQGIELFKILYFK